MIHYLRTLAARLRRMFRDRKAEREFDDEIQAHLESLTERYIRQGMTQDEATSAARRQFGNITLLKEANREIRGIRFIDTLVQDVRYGLWMLRRNPGFTFVAVLTLALGIGANTAIFSVVNAVLLRSLPYHDPERLVSVGRVPSGLFLKWREQARSFEQIAGETEGGADLTGIGEPERLRTGIVSANLFATLGLAPALGRAFTPEEDRTGGTPVAILSDALWRRRFGSDPQVIGRTLTLDGQSRTVIGVMPPGFRFPVRSDLWIPLALKVAQESSGERDTEVGVIARLKPGLTMESARADLSAILERQRQAFPRKYSDERVGVVGLSEGPVDNVRLALLILFGAVAFVLLIACANVANLLLARSAARGKEMAIRAAVGAGRLRLVRQLLTESLLLSLIGGAAGLLLASWGAKLLVAMSPRGFERIEESSSSFLVDGRVLAFTCGVVVLVGLIAGIFPALQASKVDVNETLKAQSTARSAQSGRGGVGRMLSVLMIAELALALVLLAGAGLMIKSFMRLLAVPTGLNPDGVLTLELRPHNVKNTNAYIQESLDRIQAIPGIQSAALATSIPLEGSRNQSGRGRLIEGRPSFELEKMPIFEVVCMSLEYFQTMGLQMRAGRPFTSQDGAGAPLVVIINETFARRLFPGENPIGHRLRWRGPATIVGVVGDSPIYGLDQEVPLQIYVPHMQYQDFYQDGGYIGWLVVRAASGQNNPAGLSSLAAAIRNQVRAIEPDEPVNQVVTMDEYLSNSLAGRRYIMLLLSIFAAVGLVIATVGIYGLISYSVSRRTHEIGIRMALGAQISDLLRMVVWWGMRLTLIGVTLGLGASLALTRVMNNLAFPLNPKEAGSGALFNVSATDPATFALIALLLVGFALIASYIPARRATKVDPLQALRHE
jgi:putative ABC transport system permease protein